MHVIPNAEDWLFALLLVCKLHRCELFGILKIDLFIKLQVIANGDTVELLNCYYIKAHLIFYLLKFC